jgi:nucleotide-binding universal stress UspA family protein
MYRKILVGYDGTAAGRDALALARVLRAPDGAVIAACIHPASGRDSPKAVDTLFADAAAQIVAGARARVPEDWLEFRIAPGHSPAHGLHVLSEQIEPDLVIVGSAPNGSSGQVRASSTGQRLLNGSPCAVAVAPVGFEVEADAPRVIGVAYDGSEESEVALSEATRLALESDAALRIITAVPPLPPFWSGDAFAAGMASAEEIRKQRHEAFRKQLADVAQAAPPQVRAQPILAAGRPADVIAEEAERGVHVLFVGSRSYGPIRRVMVGSTAIDLMRRSPCPMIVIPRGALTRDSETAARTPATAAAT